MGRIGPRTDAARGAALDHGTTLPRSRPALGRVLRARGAGARRPPHARGRQPHPELVLRHRRRVRGRGGAHRDRAEQARAPDALVAHGRRAGLVRRRRHHVELVRDDRRVAVPVPRGRAVPGRLPVHRLRPAAADQAPDRRRRPRRPARRRDPRHRGRDPVLDLLHPAADHRHGARSALPRDQPRLPARRPAADRRGDGPADHPGRPHPGVPDAWPQPRGAARRRPDLRVPEPRRVVRRGRRARQPVPDRVHPVRHGGRASLDATADRPGPGRRHLARARSG